MSTSTGLYNRTGHFSLVFTSDGVGAYDRVKIIIKKRIARGVIRATESDLEESKHFHYLPTADDLVKTRFPQERFETPTWRTQCHVKRLYKSESEAKSGG